MEGPSCCAIDSETPGASSDWSSPVGFFPIVTCTMLSLKTVDRPSKGLSLTVAHLCFATFFIEVYLLLFCFFASRILFHDMCIVHLLITFPPSPPIPVCARRADGAARRTRSSSGFISPPNSEICLQRISESLIKGFYSEKCWFPAIYLYNSI